MAALTATQIDLLKKLADGYRIAYSRDGDCGYLAGTNIILDDKDIWALRDRRFIDQESDEREDDYGCDRISAAGRAYITQQERKEA